MTTPPYYNCVHCGEHVPSLINKLGKSEYALQTCPTCRALCDPYIENDTLSVFVDLLLAKKSVYRHLMYNLEKRKHHLLKLAFVVTLADIYLSWSKNVLQIRNSLESASDSVAQQAATILATHCLSIAACTLFFSTKDLKWSLVPEAILLSSITRLFFMSLSLIWPQVLTSHSFDTSIDLWQYGKVKLDVEYLLSIGLEVVNRSVALSVLLRGDLAGFAIAMLGLCIEIIAKQLFSASENSSISPATQST